VGRTRFAVSRAALLDRDPACAEALYQLYRYAYDGSSADKLEIAQQFLSLAAKDLPALCASAVEIRDVTEKTYNQLLKGKVEEYFDARHKVQERVKTAIAETASSVIGLTREVSGDLYKIAGVLLGAAVGAFLEPKISAWAFLIAALLIMGYLSLVIFFHLRTMKQTYLLSMGQHRKYIGTFEDVLRDKEIKDALGDEQMGKAEAAFDKKYKQALVLYVLMLIGAALLAYIALLALLGVFSIGAAPSTATPTPVF